MHKTKSGFTIVELIIVIAVIAILAAIATIAFTGIQGKARESAAKQSLEQAKRKIAAWRVDAGNESAPENLGDVGVNNDNLVSYQYSRTNNDTNYCITATVGSTSFYISDVGTVSPTAGACENHINAGAVTPPEDTSLAFTDTAEWTQNTGAGAKTQGDEVWPMYVVGSSGLTGANIYLTNPRPIAQLHNLDISWQVSTHATNAGSQNFDVAILRGNISPGFNYGGWTSHSARATVGYTGEGVWSTIRWQSTLSGNTLTWSVTKDGVEVGADTKNISTWSETGWRFIPINSYGNRNNVQVGVKGLTNFPK